MKERRNLYVLFVSLLLWGMGESLFFLFQPLYMQELGANPILIGTILGINGMGMGFLQIPLGYLSDRYGKRLMMWFSWCLGVVAAVIMGFASNLTLFVIGYLIYGLTAAVVAPMNSYAAAARGDWSVGRAVSFIGASYNIGAFAGPVIGGILAEKYGIGMLYKIAALIFVVSTIIVFFIKDQPVEKRITVENDKGLLRNPRFLIALVIVLMVMFAMYLPYALTPNFLQNERELSLSSIGILGSTLSIASVIFALLLGHINPLTGFLIGQFAMVSFTLLIWWGNGLPWYIPAYALVGGFRLCQSLKYAFVRPFVRDHEVGFAFGVTESAGFIAFIIAPILAGFLYERNPQNIYTVGLIILSVSLVLTILVMRFKRTLTKRYLESQAELRIGD